jgi:hypothetical protein
MSLIESTVDKHKVESTKTIAKQLFKESYFRFEKQAYDFANDFYNQTRNTITSDEISGTLKGSIQDSCNTNK